MVKRLLRGGAKGWSFICFHPIVIGQVEGKILLFKSRKSIKERANQDPNGNSALLEYSSILQQLPPPIPQPPPQILVKDL